MTNEHTHMLAYWFLSYIGQKSSSSSAVNSRISRGGSGGRLKQMLTVHHSCLELVLFVVDLET